MELLCPAGNLPALKTAFEYGADAAYIGLKDETNARHFPGLNFTEKRLQEAIKITHDFGRKLHVAINTFAHPAKQYIWRDAIDRAVGEGVDVLILSDIANLDYVAEKYPEMEVHLSVQASSTSLESIKFYHREFRVDRVVIPRVLPIHQVKSLAAVSPVPLEVFAFGGLCIMAEGRCYLSSYVTGKSPNTAGACSPAEFVEWAEIGDGGRETRLNNVLIDRFTKEENAGYPTLCKGRYSVDNALSHVMEEPTSLNTIALIPDFFKMGIASVKIEGRQRSPAYVSKVTKTWREAIDHYLTNPETFQVKEHWEQALNEISEGRQTTLGAYHRKWL